MVKLSKLTFKIIIVLLNATYLMSCTGGAASSSFGSTGSDSNASYVPPGASNGIVDTSLFYVGVDSTVNDVAHVHTTGQFGTTCSINPASSLQDITCIIDIPEAELFMHGLALKYNVPSDMCRYLRRRPYWYYNDDVGYGVSSIVINRVYTDNVFTSATCSINGAGAGPCNSNPEVFIDPIPTAPTLTCVYDHTLSGGKNGCLGAYSLTINTTSNVTAPPSSTASSSNSAGSWGTSISSIIGGAARNGWPLSSDGYPLTMITPADKGLLNNIYTIAAPLDSIATHSTMEIANYYTPALHTHDGFVLGTTSSLPYPIDPIDDISGSPIVAGEDAYLFECRDQADEMLHRIKVYVREWDTYQDWVDYIESKGTVEVPDRRGGVEGTNCVGIAGPCNDYFDLDDFGVANSSYPTNSPGNNGNRPDYFPKILSK